MFRKSSHLSNTLEMQLIKAYNNPWWKPVDSSGSYRRKVTSIAQSQRLYWMYINWTIHLSVSQVCKFTFSFSLGVFWLPSSLSKTCGGSWAQTVTPDHHYSSELLWTQATLKSPTSYSSIPQKSLQILARQQKQTWVQPQCFPSTRNPPEWCCLSPRFYLTEINKKPH